MEVRCCFNGKSSVHAVVGQAAATNIAILAWPSASLYCTGHVLQFKVYMGFWLLVLPDTALPCPVLTCPDLTYSVLPFPSLSCLAFHSACSLTKAIPPL